MNAYRERIWADMEAKLAGLGTLDEVLDFGCGDGWFSEKVKESGFAKNLTSLDVKRRKFSYVEPIIYQGGSKLPFQEDFFDLVYSIDVLHHCSNPISYLDELAKVSKRYILIKDHTYSTLVGKLTLAVLDEIGNRKFGIPSNYLYQKSWEWEEYLMGRGWVLKSKVWPERCHTGVLGKLTNQFQYMSLFEKFNSR